MKNPKKQKREPGQVSRALVFAAGALLSAVIAIPVTLVLAPTMAQLLSRGPAQSVEVDYRLMPAASSLSNDPPVPLIAPNKDHCRVYVLIVKPGQPGPVVKQASIHVHFPTQIQSFIFITDRFRDYAPESFPFSMSLNTDSCSVDAPSRGEAPPNIDVRRTGQQRTDLDMRVEDLTPDSTFILMVGTEATGRTDLVVRGEAIYSVWNQDLPAVVVGNEW